MEPTDPATKTPIRVILGPQPQQRGPSGDAYEAVAAAVRDVHPGGRVALITAGWREREGEDAALRTELSEELSTDDGDAVVNLRLYQRRDEILDHDEDLAEVDRQLYRQLHELQRLHRLRLDPTLGTLQRLDREKVRAGDPEGELLQGERAAAVAAVRELDRHHLDTVARVRSKLAMQWRGRGHSEFEAHREQVLEILESCAVVVIAGGHVQALLECLRTFELSEPLAERALVVWSAGAMALASTVLLFHDRPPWGEGNAEVLDRGLDLLPGLLPLPDAERRLRLDDSARMAQLTQRMAPLVPVTLDPGARVELRPGGWWGSSTSVLLPNGERKIVGEGLEPVVGL